MDLLDRLNHLTRASVEAIRPLPPQGSPIANDRYVIKRTAEDCVHAFDNQLRTKIWFKSPPLQSHVIRRIRGLKLFAESHDQGYFDDKKGGNWTWLELAILEDERATSPKTNEDGKELVWLSHPNKVGSSCYEWLQGETFDKRRDFLSSLKGGNVIAVRLCARFQNWGIYVRNGYLVIDIGSDDDPVPIRPIPLHENTKALARRSVTKWFQEAQNPDNDTALELSLFINAMAKFQSLPPNDQLSYYRIAGIHSSPRNVPWNMGNGPIPYNDPNLDERIERGEGGAYCMHNKVLFPTWHRAYMMLFERTISDLMMEEAKSRRHKQWILAATRWRLPYWDWAAEPCLPELVLMEQISIVDAWDPVTRHAHMRVIPNPMYRFQMPGGRPMGDPSYGDYRIDNAGEGPWDACIGTSRHAISLYDEQRLWVQGHTDVTKTNAALQRPSWPSELAARDLTLKDAVFRLLTANYCTKYDHFASTKHADSPDHAQCYLSLEGIHNSVHNCIGGNNFLSGLGHMAYVSVAAFDPVFWLHHCNVDRLLYLWQCSNPDKWITQIGGDDGAETDLVPFHRSGRRNDFFNSDGLRRPDSLHYTFDDMESIVDSDGEICKEYLNKHINTLYGPVPSAFNDPRKDVDPVINIIYDRYALDGLQYALHFFLGRVDRNIPYQHQRNLVGSVYTFTFPFAGPNGTTRCPNCRQQAKAGVLSHAQIPLTRSVAQDERRTPADARNYFQRELQWVAVLDSGAKIPSKTLGNALEITLLLGANQLPDGLEGEPNFSGYEPVGFDWKNAEIRDTRV
ncbi:tyrosinase central domain containing protein [Diplodia corticola]|uniref:tyrosinase n=1 Tax=Diplodia corticola TaxID=236234 RepID=A0A1J9QJX4_9PEZI|nr:tyrosinase central domain containing protein [Diplodia corticola]OJD29174.1 tyrosinase central domain containing protein [Diplodia corticola]